MVDDLKVIWSKTADNQLQKVYDYIKEDSLQSAQKVKKDILNITKNISKAPTRYPLDKYRKNNEGDIRAFEKHSLRISYQIRKAEIRIIRVRHTSREPLKY